MLTKNNTQLDTFVTTRTAAKMLNVSLRTIQLWVESGVLKAWKTAGGHRKVSINSIETVLAQRQQSLNIQNKSIQDTKPRSLNTPFKILLVEDDEGLRQLFRFYFTDWKREVSFDIACNGFEGLISLGRKIPDLLVTDLNMPSINGFDLLSYLNNAEQFKKLDIIVITALPPEDYENNVAITSNIRIFPKPLDFEVFESYILSLIDKK